MLLGDRDRETLEALDPQFVLDALCLPHSDGVPPESLILEVTDIAALTSHLLALDTPLTRYEKIGPKQYRVLPTGETGTGGGPAGVQGGSSENGGVQSLGRQMRFRVCSKGAAEDVEASVQQFFPEGGCSFPDWPSTLGQRQLCCNKVKVC